MPVPLSGSQKLDGKMRSCLLMKGAMAYFPKRLVPGRVVRIFMFRSCSLSLSAAASERIQVSLLTPALT